MTSTSLRLLVWLTLLLLLAPRTDAQDFSASHLEAAEEVLVVANTGEVMARAIDEMLNAQIQQNPALGGFEDVMRDFLAEHLSWEAVRGDLIRTYAAAFTEDELGEIAAFYRTPTGRKAVAAMPSLMAEGMRLGQQRVQDHLPDLQRRIRERMGELDDQ